MAEEIYAPIIDTEMTMKDALKRVFQIARSDNKCVRGTRQSCKKIMGGQAKLVLISKEVSSQISDVVMALTKKHSVPVITIESSEELGSIVGLARIRGGEVTKVTKCSVAVVMDYVRPSPERNFVLNALRDEKNK
ncbi:40S ribosomal protein S12 [Astathelohania contejeani]|uniref:40S ribosomal protein S12 n=1 Tax=Astathelohania contejeani TaxID=164912 RepID=A0ABQ7HWS9_9MICR|nr:40S ribosomal protein S12 [Thelohania contejeani]